MDWLSSVKKIIEQVSGSDATEVELARDGFRLRVRRSPSLPTDNPVAGAVGQEANQHQHVVVAPLTGVFYRSPAPHAPPFVNEGDWVETDSVIGLIESMKVFNEVSPDQPGRIVRFLAESGQLVHAGDPLVELELAQGPHHPDVPPSGDRYGSVI